MARCGFTPVPYRTTAVDAGAVAPAVAYADTGGIRTLVLANGVLTPIRGNAPGDEVPQVTVRLDRPVHDRILAGRDTFETAIAAGDVTLTGDPVVLALFHGPLETPDRALPIVTP